jgi:hypothetical protein
MAVTPQQIREGLAANLAALGRTVGLQVSAYMLSAPTPPWIDIFPEPVKYDLAFGRGLDEWQYAVRAFVGLNSDVGAQQKLDTMLEPAGANSVKQAVESDITLGGTVSSVHVTEASGSRLYTGGVLGCIWTVVIKAPGK